MHTSALLAVRVVPALEIRAVTHEPIFCPSVIKIAAFVVTTPFMARVCNIPTDADELCKIAVTTIPISIPRNGLLPTILNAFEKIGASVYGAIDALINSSPSNRRPIPTNNSPTVFDLSFFEKRLTNAPMPIRSGA